MEVGGWRGGKGGVIYPLVYSLIDTHFSTVSPKALTVSCHTKTELGTKYTVWLRGVRGKGRGERHSRERNRETEAQREREGGRERETETEAVSEKERETKKDREDDSQTDRDRREIGDGAAERRKRGREVPKRWEGRERKKKTG